MCVCSHSRSLNSSRFRHSTTELAHRWPYLVFIGLWLIASDGWAQGPLRRIGGRVREAIQSGGPLAPPQAPAAPGTRGPAAQAPAGVGRSANYQRAADPRHATGSQRSTGSQRAAGTASSHLSVRPSGPGSLPAGTRPYTSAMANRLTQPTYAAPVSNRPIEKGRPPVGATTAAFGEIRSLEVAKLGFIVSDDTVMAVNRQSARPPRGVLVLSVLVGSGGDAAGLASGDRLLAVNGRLVNQAEPLVDLVDQIAPGDPVELKFNRDGKLYSSIGLASGPTGKLDKEEFAIVRQQAREMLGEVAATQGELPAAKGSEADETTAGNGSALGSIGSALGSWLGGTASKPKPLTSETDRVTPVAAEPNARDVDTPATANGGEYKSLRPSVGVLATSGWGDSDPPSLENQPAVDGAGEGTMEVAERLPAPQPAAEEATIEQLLKEIRLLRERIQQLEAQKTPEVR